jgi:hypothetical protein
VSRLPHGIDPCRRQNRIELHVSSLPVPFCRRAGSTGVPPSKSKPWWTHQLVSAGWTFEVAM